MALINTTHGPMDESLLTRVDIKDEDDAAHYEAVEYYLDGELVHRSAHVQLKKGLNWEGVTASLS